MGSSVSISASSGDKFHVSKTCADQFLLEDKMSAEEKWMVKLKKLDDEHSRCHQLTKEGFDKLLTELDKTIKSSTIPTYCKNRDLLIECLRVNPNCMLNCKREMDEFIDCVDAIRIGRIKEIIRESKRKNRAQIDAMFTP